MNCARTLSLCAVLLVFGCQQAPDRTAEYTSGMERIVVAPDGSGFVSIPSGRAFVAWGFNYDHDRSGRLLEAYANEWQVVEEDFREMRQLGANVVRVFWQLPSVMVAPDSADPNALALVARVVRLAEQEGLYLNLTGLGCLEPQRVPPWYDALTESERWKVQACFWRAVAGVCVGRPSVFCYNLMNEPILPGAGDRATNWYLGELGGKFWAQRLTLDLAGRTPEDVARAWIEMQVSAIRTIDDVTMITVGDIAGAHINVGSRPIISSAHAASSLDFISVHLYPRAGQARSAEASLAVYDIGKPIVVEEMAPLYCGIEDLSTFIDSSRSVTDGWLGFYWGETEEELERQTDHLPAVLMRQWLQMFRSKGQVIARPMTEPH